MRCAARRPGFDPSDKNIDIMEAKRSSKSFVRNYLQQLGGQEPLQESRGRSVCAAGQCCIAVLGSALKRRTDAPVLY